ncbi:MAG: GFA family protein [Povalibacter sp.]
MKKTYTGGCHCGAVRYEADMDLSQGTIRCNCSICSKGRAWLTFVKGPDFRLIKGEDALAEYEFGSHRIHHMFCKSCGIKPFARGAGADGSAFHAVVIGTLENVPDEELAALPVMYVDGRHDNFKAPPAETRHL